MIPDKSKLESCFMGTATLNERGQVVIPIEARKELDIHPGDKFLIWKHPSGEGLMLVKMNTLRAFMEHMNQMLTDLETAAEPNEKDRE